LRSNSLRSSQPERDPHIKYLETPPRVFDEALRNTVERVERERTRKDADRLRKQQTGRGSLLNFVRYFWHVLEPPKRDLVEGWPLEAISEHLEAITFGDLKRLLINVPPGFMKSLLVNVFWPAWEWGPMNMPHLRHLAFSYAEDLTTRDNNKLVKLVTSPRFRALWGDRFTMVKTGERRPENDHSGFVLATSIRGVGTGERGDRVRLDDPHNVIKIESQLVRENTVRFVRESMFNRVNDDDSAIIVVMQRLHENDVSGDILAREADYCHLIIPMRFDPMRYPVSADGLRIEYEDGEPFGGNDIGWIDPRALDDDGELLSPRDMEARDGELAWGEFETELGPIAYAGQYQQSPTPRSGNIFKRPHVPSRVRMAAWRHGWECRAGCIRLTVASYRAWRLKYFLATGGLSRHNAAVVVRTAPTTPRACEDMSMNPWSSQSADELLADLERAMSQVHEMLADRPPVMTTAYLLQLQTAVEALGIAIKENRWVSEGQIEFQGE
jgi:hypothetical protein